MGGRNGKGTMMRKGKEERKRAVGRSGEGGGEEEGSETGVEG